MFPVYDSEVGKNIVVKENGKIQIAKMKINLYSYLGSHSKHTMYYVVLLRAVRIQNLDF